jgi:hypothetical protein
MAEPAKLDEQDGAGRLLGILDMVRLTIAKESDTEWLSEAEKTHEVAQLLDVPYLALWIARDSHFNDPSVTIADVDEMMAHPFAAAVVRKWAATVKGAKAKEGEG